MIFSTYTFVVVFLPIVLLVYFALLSTGFVKSAKWSLVIASLYFYAHGSGDFFPAFLISIGFNYLLGRGLGSRWNEQPTIKRCMLILGIGANVGLLGYYKYTDFGIANFNYVFSAEMPLQNIVMPIGISFFTFQLIAYLIDSYRGQTVEYELLNYLLFITFLPQLIVGPIVHHDEVVPQYDAIQQSGPDWTSVSRGIFLFAIGCAKKLTLADPLAEWAQNSFDHAQSLNMVESWTASLGYTISYYFDLSGYADMAIGVGLLFGNVIPANFNSPYKARNFADYWRRWHITLSKFLGDYIFRSVYNKSKGSANFYWALFVTFLVSDFWHGAGWTFVVWGIVNGIFVIWSHMMKRAGLALPHLLAWSLTFAGVVATRVLFVSSSFGDAIHVLTEMVNYQSFSLTNNPNLAIRAPLYIAIGLFITLALPNSNELAQRFRPSFRFGLASVLLIVISLLNMSNVRGFLYFQF